MCEPRWDTLLLWGRGAPRHHHGTPRLGEWESYSVAYAVAAFFWAASASACAASSICFFWARSETFMKGR